MSVSHWYSLSTVSEKSYAMWFRRTWERSDRTAKIRVEVIALDAYANAPAMQVADRSHVVSMLDGAALREIILQEKPDLVVPEVEAIATDVAELESEGQVTIIPRPGPRNSL